MRPRNPNDVGKKGKGPSRKRRRRAVTPEVESDGSWEADVQGPVGRGPPVIDVDAQEGLPGADLDAQEGQAGAGEQDDVLDPRDHHLPDELLGLPRPEPDMSDEEGEDHTGFWRPQDMEQLILALNHYRHCLRGKFTGTSGGKERKDQAWAKVAEYVNTRCGTEWNVGQCKGKSRRQCLLVKQKYNALRRELMKTGNREIPERMYLTRLEEMLLDYVGVEGVIGIPGLHAVPLRPDLGRDYLKIKTAAATTAWDHARPDKPNYRDPLPQGRVNMNRRN